MISAVTLALLGAVAYVLAYVGTWAGAEAGHLSQLLASVPRDPSPSQARALVEWDASGELFEKNRMRVRVEGRFGVSVYRPEAIVKVGTAA
ncbi:hypothetical protein [Gordonia sp. CPCC 205333]|uniref:hypothetical protein n=1 Tax=Gordonia sp. CPCC 205333 TaxID=3140790 RepID=UPI003AF3E600